MYKIHAGLWDSSNKVDTFTAPANVGVSWSHQQLGVDRVEVDIVAFNMEDLWRRQRDHMGLRMAVYLPSYRGRPITGNVTSISLIAGNIVRYVARIKPRFDGRLNTTAYAETDTVSDTIEGIVSVYSQLGVTDFSQIQSNPTQLGGWSPTQPNGSRLSTSIKQLVDKSDASDNRYYFYFRDERFSGTTPQSWQPVYEAVSISREPDWFVNARDLRRLQQSRELTAYTTNAQVSFGTSTGTHTGAIGSPNLVDGVANFVTLGVKSGDKVLNLTTGGQTNVTSVTITALTCDGGSTGTTFATGDAYAVQLQQPIGTAVATPATPLYWRSDFVENRKEMTNAQALQYAGSKIANTAEQFVGFTISSPFVRNRNGATVPLFQMIAEGGGYIRIEDLYPSPILFGEGADTLTTFLITGLKLDYTSNSMTVQIDNKNQDLDARLAEQNILRTLQVDRFPNFDPVTPDRTPGANPPPTPVGRR